MAASTVAATVDNGDRRSVATDDRQLWSAIDGVGRRQLQRSAIGDDYNGGEQIVAKRVNFYLTKKILRGKERFSIQFKRKKNITKRKKKNSSMDEILNFVWG